MLLRRWVSLVVVLTSLIIPIQAQSGTAHPSASRVIESTVPFPSPVQWSLNLGNGDADISLSGLAWGPATATEMIAKGNEPIPNQKSEFFPDRPYVLALGLKARISNPVLDVRTRSGLVLITDSNGTMELPWILTSSGLVRNAYDVHFAMGKVMAQYWDFFPIRPDQKEFLFEVRTSSRQVLYFTVILKEKTLVVVNSTPAARSDCIQFDKTFGGSIGADSLVRLQIKRQNTTLSGSEQYTKIGKTLWLAGVVDSLGRFIIEERYPRNQVTAILKGRFDSGYKTMSGYFSKPDGSRLQPFEFHEIEPDGTQPPVHPSGNCTTSEDTEEPLPPEMN
jgi:hypothetical protein